MQLFGKDLANSVAIVAEIGVNHEGDVEAASRLLKLAAAAGCDAVKFQSYTPERFISSIDATRFERVKRFGLNLAAHERLKAEAEAAGTIFFSTAVTEDWVDTLAAMCPAIKIASGDLTFEPVIRRAARSGKPMIVSTGLGTAKEVDRTVSWVREEVGAAALPDRLVLMQCVSAYPTPIEEANVLGVPFLAERYSLHVGYSHHTIGLEPCYAAIAHGASVVEVHFTDQKNGREFRDHSLSAEPDELAALVKAAPRIRAALGSRGKERQPCEVANVEAVRKGVIAARDLAAGAVLSRDDLSYARPATAIPASELESLVGRRLATAVARGVSLKRSDLAN